MRITRHHDSYPQAKKPPFEHIRDLALADVVRRSFDVPFPRVEQVSERDFCTLAISLWARQLWTIRPLDTKHFDLSERVKIITHPTWRDSSNLILTELEIIQVNMNVWHDIPPPESDLKYMVMSAREVLDGGHDLFCDYVASGKSASTIHLLKSHQLFPGLNNT